MERGENSNFIVEKCDKLYKAKNQYRGYVHSSYVFGELISQI